MTVDANESIQPGVSGKKRLIWLSVNSSYSHSSLALPLLHSACGEQNEWEWIPLEITTAEDPAETAVRLSALKGDLLCVTLYLFNRNSVLEILERFHTLSPECRIAAGGPECLGDGAEKLRRRAPYLHAVFRGEGEGVFPDFLNSFSTFSASRIIPAEGNAVYEAWETAPPPAGDPFFRVDKPFVQLETSRGCPMGCLYCTSGRTKLRIKSMEAVAQELELLRRRGAKEIRLLDRTFNVPQERGAALLRLFRTEFPDLRFHLEIHPQFLNEELREELRNAPAGQLHVEAGIQCLSEKVQHAIGRNSASSEALDGLAFLCSRPNFETHADLLAGLPEQSLEDLFRDLATLMTAGPAEIQLEILKLLPGTPLRNQAEALGLFSAPEPPYDVMRTPLLTPDEILLSRKLSRLLDLTYNHPALHPVLRAMSAGKPDFLPELLAFFQTNGLDLKRLFDLKKRFLLLEEFLSVIPCPHAAEELACQWICAGYTPENGPGRAAEKADAIPSGALLTAGTHEAAEERESKFWKLRVRNTVVYFAFNRKYEFNRPAGIWKQTI